jgi:hydrogenase expression/formation protein HypE
MRRNDEDYPHYREMLAGSHRENFASLRIMERGDVVAGACELLGLDPLYIANEGKLLAFIDPEAADAVLQSMKVHRLGEKATIIGEVDDATPGRVVMQTAIGSWRILDMPVGEQLPRIC